MDIRHVGQSIVNTPEKSLSLKNVLHVPNATKNLASAHRLLVIMMFILKFILGFSLLRIGQRGE
jgi:hypothetical protein